MSSVANTIADMARAATYLEHRVTAGLRLDDDELDLLGIVKNNVKTIRRKSRRQVERVPLAETNDDQLAGRFRLEDLFDDWRPRYVADPMCRLRFRADSRCGSVRVAASSLDELVELAAEATSLLVETSVREAA